LVAPAMSWAELKGTGTETDPYLLGTPEDLLEMRSVLKYGQMTHFKMIADISMAGITSWVPLNSSGSSEIALAEGATAEEAAIVAKESCALGSAEEYTKYIGFDGDGHNISNFIIRVDADAYREARGWSYKSFFGVLAGYCRNVGFINCTAVDNNLGCGIIAGYLGHPKYEAAGYKESVIEGCIVSGGNTKETGTSYIGALVGNVATKSIIRNCAVLQNVFATSGAMAGGVIGRISAEVTLENIDCWGNKSVNALNFGGGPDKDAFLAGTKKIPYSSVGAVFAERKSTAKVNMKNVYAPFGKLFGNFWDGDGAYTATPFGPIDLSVDTYDVTAKNVLTSPWTQKYGETTIVNGAFNEGTPENLQLEYKGFCFDNDGDVNILFGWMCQSGAMTGGLMYTSNNIDSKQQAVVYSQPRWYMGKTEFAGGDGTPEKPYIISTPVQLGNMYKAVCAAYTANFKLANDIECGSFDYLPPLGWDAVNYTQSLNFDGNYHVIKDFKPSRSYKGLLCIRGVVDVAYQSLFGVFAGSVKNLGMTGAVVFGKDHNTDNTSTLIDGAGIMCAYAGHTDAKMGATFDNCYVEGTVMSDAYAGGLAGTTGNDGVVVNNCWANVATAGLSMETLPTIAGGIIGRTNGKKVTLNNVVARGDISGDFAAGLTYSSDAKSVIEVTEAISWVATVEGEEASAGILGDAKVTGNVYTFANTEVNGKKVQGGKTAAELLAIAQAWTEWSSTKNNDGYPMICWEAGEEQPNGSVAPVVGDNAVVAYGGEGVIYVKGASVVYNMNGQVVYSGAEETVNVPAGLYIVKVGGNATKVAVK
ncbi:MAG: T9SS type A sorting domain-containing protein, partial [Muribaculaceae bacterium]|nr:T9SS type A sorting domain-containing protein [Muribaculaceae bacterium]